MSDVSVAVSVDEWRAVAGWLWRSLSPDENLPEGHLHLECRGAERTWTATDGAQRAVHRCEGPQPRGAASASALVNPRLFRWREPQDAVLRVRGDAGRRVISLAAGKVVTQLPEHPGVRSVRRVVTGELDGLAVRVDTVQLRDAVCAAIAPPLDQLPLEVVPGELLLVDGQLRVTTEWAEAPASDVRIDVADSGRTAPTMYDLRRLRNLLDPIDLPISELVVSEEGGTPLGIRAGGYEAALAPFDPLRYIRIHLETLLGELLGTARVNRDGDGDYPVNLSSEVRAYVRLFNLGSPAVRVFSVVAAGIFVGDDIDREINAINADTPHVKLARLDEVVLARVDLSGSTLDVQGLDHAFRCVRMASVRYRGLFSAVYGGVSTLEEPDW